MVNNSPTYLSDFLPTSTREIKWPRLYIHSTDGVESCFKTITVCSWSFPLLCFPSKEREQRQRGRCISGKSASLHLCLVVTEFFMIIFLLQKRESDQTLCWKGLPLYWFHHKCAPSQERLHGPWLTNPNFSASSLSHAGTRQLWVGFSFSSCWNAVHHHWAQCGAKWTLQLVTGIGAHPTSLGKGQRAAHVAVCWHMSCVWMGSGDSTPSHRQFKTRFLEAFFLSLSLPYPALYKDVCLKPTPVKKW